MDTRFFTPSRIQRQMFHRSAHLQLHPLTVPFFQGGAVKGGALRVTLPLDMGPDTNCHRPKKRDTWGAVPFSVSDPSPLNNPSSQEREEGEKRRGEWGEGKGAGFALSLNVKSGGLDTDCPTPQSASVLPQHLPCPGPQRTRPWSTSAGTTLYPAHPQHHSRSRSGGLESG